MLDHSDNEMRYARIVPDHIAGTIAVACSPAAKQDKTQVSVTYDITSLGPDGAEFVTELEATYNEFLEDWRQQIVAVGAADPERATGQPLGATPADDEDMPAAGPGDRESADAVRSGRRKSRMRMRCSRSSARWIRRRR